MLILFIFIKKKKKKHYGRCNLGLDAERRHSRRKRLKTAWITLRRHTTSDVPTEDMPVNRLDLERTFVI
jgi:hypothetical protein